MRQRIIPANLSSARNDKRNKLAHVLETVEDLGAGRAAAVGRLVRNSRRTERLTLDDLDYIELVFAETIRRTVP